jgi:hypothetical protein
VIWALLACTASEPGAQASLDLSGEPALFLAPGGSTLLAGGDLRWVFETWPELQALDEIGLGTLRPVALIGGRRGLVAVLPGGELEPIRGTSGLELAKSSEDRVNLALPEGGRLQARQHEGFLLLGDLSQVQRLVEPESRLSVQDGDLPQGESWVLIRHPRRLLDEASSRLAREGLGQDLARFRQDSGWTLAGLDRIGVARSGDALRVRVHCQEDCTRQDLLQARLAQQALLLAGLPEGWRPWVQALDLELFDDHIQGEAAIPR